MQANAMKSRTSRAYVKSVLLAGASAVAALSLAGCGLFGDSWDVKLEVTGKGSAGVDYNFSGETEPKHDTRAQLPWTKTQNVGYGFNSVSVNHAAPGTVCRIYVDGKLKEEKKPDAKGNLSCNVSVQN
ncbi:MmpS family transport accessory protein [Streptomyces sp. NPDC004296]|uniref:MmpS family transport accessory protein n=1 Tax=Streptomyces sp. NPDC004296 TaxID=3364697 RepID=UPI0036C714C9